MIIKLNKKILRISRVFRAAKKHSSYIIFIDEIDAIGKKRGQSLGGNDGREQTINQLLVEMDGFSETSGIIVIAATNRAEILDTALLRPGRFDRHIYVNLPDSNGRYEILKIHTQKKKLDINVNLEKISKMTIGFSGADLANLTNEAAILAARLNSNTITHVHFEQALEKIRIGAKKENAIMTDDKKKIVAYHESGHAIAAIKEGDFDKLNKVTIISHGKSGGLTIFEPLEDQHLLSKQVLQVI